MPDSFPDQAVALPLPVPVADRRAVRLPKRFIKMGITGSFLFAGIYGVVSEHKYVSTTDAVVSSYVLSVRTPIDGTVTGMPLAAGIYVRQGDLLGQMDNPRVDRQHLDNLLTVEDIAKSTADALALEQQKLSYQQKELVARSDAHISAVSGRLQIAISEAEHVLEARRLALQEANIELDRGKKLHDAGILATADYDRLLSAQEIADREYAAQQANLDAIRSQAEAAQHGLLTEPGTNNDVSYSRQRADELAIKLAENSRVLLSSRAQAMESQAAVQTEAARAELLRHTDLRSPIDGLVWRLNAVNSEHASAGDTILSLVDCHRQFIVAEIPQDRVPDVALHQTARFRLAGESEERTGTVVSVSGDTQGMAAKLSAFPKTDPSQGLAAVIVSVSGGSGSQDTDSCLVGRSARVLIPTAPSNVASRWVRNHF